MAGTDIADIAVAANNSDLRISLSQIPFVLSKSETFAHPLNKSDTQLIARLSPDRNTKNASKHYIFAS
jgi:hypothetical protein